MPKITSHAQLPSSARARRAAHIQRSNELHARKRLRRQRREIGDLLAQARRRQVRVLAGPFKATDRKVGGVDWEVVDDTGAYVAYCTSRDKARKFAKDANENGGIKVTISHTEALRHVGLVQVATRGPIEERYHVIQGDEVA